jgi:hypothetical protein
MAALRRKLSGRRSWGTRSPALGEAPDTVRPVRMTLLPGVSGQGQVRWQVARRLPALVKDNQQGGTGMLDRSYDVSDG